MKRFILLSLLTLIFLFTGCSTNKSAFPKLDEKTLVLPNGQTFELWQDSTSYSKTYYVDQNNRGASDKNSGSFFRPFKTISRAAELLQAGQRVIVKAGVYRETIRPKHGGNDNASMIHYMAAPGETVVIKGSEIFSNKWTNESDTLWSANISNFLSKLAQQENLLPAQVEHMVWAKKTLGKTPYTLSPLLIYLNGERLSQAESKKSLTTSKNSYFIDKNSKRLSINFEPGTVPENFEIEVAFRESLFKPLNPNTSFIKLSGFIFEHSANRFPRAQIGAVSTFAGEKWIIQNNTIREANSICLDIGSGWHWKDIPQFKGGSHLVTGNHISSCGVSGISGHHVKNVLIAENLIEEIGWQKVERFWETGAIKVHLPEHSLIAKNRIKKLKGSPGIWLDFLPVNSRVTENTVEDMQSIAGAIVVEAAQSVNLVDNNTIWDVESNGIYQRDSDKTHIRDNILGGISHYTIYSGVPRKRMVGGRESTSVDNIFERNIIYDYSKKPKFKEIKNIIKNNIYLEKLTN